MRRPILILNAGSSSVKFSVRGQLLPVLSPDRLISLTPVVVGSCAVWLHSLTFEPRRRLVTRMDRDRFHVCDSLPRSTERPDG